MDLETRIAKLEQSNRQQRFVIACLALMLFASFIFGGRLVSQANAAQSGRKMELNQLTITNRNGDPIIVLRGDAPRSENPGIQLTGNTSAFECFDEANRKTFSLGVLTGDVAYKGELKHVR